MSTYHKLKVKEIIAETIDTCSIVFDVPTELKSEFVYTQGQYLSLKKVINGEEVIRAYSLSSAPHESDLKVSVKRIEGGIFSSYATQELKVGDILEVFPPRGSFFTDLSSDNNKSYVAFAAGSGITPVISILKATLDQEKESKFTLFYGNKNLTSIIFRSELDGLMAKYSSRLSVYHLLSREGATDVLNGRLSGEKCETFSTDMIDFTLVDEAFLCGPQDMVESISSFLSSKGINDSSIHFELFYAAPSDKIPEEVLNTDFDKSSISLVVDGDEFEFDVPAGKFILDTAIEEDLDVPFACKSGVCCTCKAKVMSGKVKMVNNYALEMDEVEAGYVLTCQSIPLTEHVSLDMDE